MRILRLLTDECHRWGHVIWNPYFVPHEGMRSFLNTKRLLPTLQALDLREHESEDWDPTDSTFAGATSLRELTMQIRDPTQTKLQLGQIRHLRITRMSIPVGIIPFFGELSISCPILQSLYLEVDDVPVGAQDGTHEISFFMLECLEFKTMTWYELDWIFSTLTLPSLRKLSLDDCCDVDPFTRAPGGTDAFYSFISRSKCPLSALKLILPRNPSGVPDLLRSAPSSVIELTLHESYGWSFINKDLVQSLHTPSSINDFPLHSQQSATILPNLRKLDLRVDVGKEDFDSSTLLDMIQSRISNDDAGDTICKCLEDIKIGLRNGGNGSDLQKCLQSLRKPGVTIEVFHL